MSKELRSRIEALERVLKPSSPNEELSEDGKRWFEDFLSQYLIAAPNEVRPSSIDKAASRVDEM